MRTHTTLTLRTLIVNDMDATKHQMTRQEINVWTELLPQIAAEMFKHMNFLTNSIFQKGLVRRQICQIQRECIFLLDMIDRYQDLLEPIAKLKSEVIKCLDSIFERIDTHCGKYADAEIYMPVIHLRKEQVAVENQMNLLVAGFKKHDVERKLQEVILACMKDLLKAKRCFYYRLAYVKNLQAALLEICNCPHKAAIQESLIHHLYGCNYNNTRFTKYLQDRITEKLAGVYEVAEQFKMLYSYQREFATNTYRKSAGCYDLKNRKNKEVMVDFINAELRYLEKKEGLKVPAAQPVQVVLQNAVPAAVKALGYRIRTSLSVDSLAYLIRLLVEANAIEAAVKTELLAFIADIFQTPGMGDKGISAGSLGTKYKQVVQSTATRVRALLKKMLKQLDGDFGFG